MKYLIVLVALALLAGCATQPMNRDKLAAHADRNCRVEAAVSKSYKIDSTGIDTRSTAYNTCMRRQLLTAAR